jgi:hypothetical protein
MLSVITSRELSERKKDMKRACTVPDRCSVCVRFAESPVGTTPVPSQGFMPGVKRGGGENGV